MIVTDASSIPLPGKRAEAVALAKETVAYLDQRWPLSQPRMLIEDLTDGRIHVISLKASLAEHESQVAEEYADEGFMTTAQKIDQLIVPGTLRQTYSHVL
jgi:hypothetical protein